MIRRALTVRIEEGIHLRVATSIVELVEGHDASVSVEHEGQRAEARSAIELLALGMVPGASIVASASGPDEARVMARLSALIEGEDARDGD